MVDQLNQHLSVKYQSKEVKNKKNFNFFVSINQSIRLSRIQQTLETFAILCTLSNRNYNKSCKLEGV